jgi:hypothetical protein
MKSSDEPINFAGSDADPDPLIEIIYRFSKTVSAGAARRMTATEVPFTL